MLGRCRPNVWAYDMYPLNSLSSHIYANYSHGPWKVYFIYTFHFLVSPCYYYTFSGTMKFSFLRNLNYYNHEFHGIENSSYDHVLVHVHGFGTISHSLQGMVRIELDGISHFSSKTHYFAQQQEDVISIQSIS